MEGARRNIYLRFLSWASAFLFLAFAWEYWRRGGPLRSLFWDENLMSSFVESLGWTWSNWVTSLQVDLWIKIASQAISILFLICAILSLLYTRYHKKIIKWGLLAGTLVLFFQVILSVKNHFWQVGQMMELTLQWISPIILILAIKDSIDYNKLERIIRITIAITFIGHALYAIGFYPVPGHFLSMMMNGFGINNESAKISLMAIGWLDIIAAVLLLFPRIKASKWALVYIVSWGFLTAIARLWSNASFYPIDLLLDEWLAQSMLRWVHFLVPLSLLYLEKAKQARAQSVSLKTDKFTLHDFK